MKRPILGLWFAVAAFCLGVFQGLTPVLGAVRTGVAYSTSADATTGRRPKYWREVLEDLDPNLRVFTHLLMKLEKQQVTSVEYNLFEDDDTPLWSRINFAAGYAAGAVSIVVDDGTVFGTNFRVINSATGEVMLVTGVASNTLTVTRGYNGSSAAAIVDRDWLLVFGELVYEGGDIGSIRTYVPTTVTNYTEIFREPYGYTNTDAAEEKRGPNDPERDRVKALRNIKKRMEFSLRFGVKREEGAGATLQRHTGGFESYVSTNVFSANGALSEPFLLAVAEKVFRYGTGEKLFLCGRQARMDLAALGLKAESVISATDSRNWLGIKIERFVTPFGDWGFVTDHSLQNGYADRCHIVDIGHVNLAVLRGLKHLMNRQGNGEDQVKNEFLTELGLMLALEKAHGYIKQTTLSL